ncbi:MAG: hypothetical protein IJD48_04495 [Clostridia bacterium]|nr:hypothetical protein [Clostridia bacterium]
MALFCVALALCGVAINAQAYTQNNIQTQQETQSEYTDQYKRYLSLSKEEQDAYEVIPRMYEVPSESLYTSKSYNNLLTSHETLPTEYSLFNIPSIMGSFSAANTNSTASLPVNVGNQQQVGICWAFAALTAFETSLYQMDVIDLSTVVNFSELDMAYTSKILNWGLTTLGGGSFSIAYEYLSSGQGPVNEKLAETTSGNIYWSNDEYAKNFYKNNFYNSRTHSGYSALESYAYPSVSSFDYEGKQNLRNSIKNHIKNYGSVVASIYMDDGLVNKGYYCYSGGLAINHNICLVGWDDDAFYEDADGTIHTGAYIAQNSWGTDFGYNGYFYIMYDDIYVETDLYGFVRVDEALSDSLLYNNLEGTQLNNKFFTAGTGYLTSGGTLKLVNFYETKDVNNQYISRIKVPTVSESAARQSRFYVYVLNNLSATQVSSDNNIKATLAAVYNQKTRVKNIHATGDDEYLFDAQQSTFYTVEVGSQISLNNDYFAICVEYLPGSGVQYIENTNKEDAVSSNMRTYIYSSKWQYYSSDIVNPYSEDTVQFFFPMQVETEYVLNTINYQKNNVDQVYDAKEHIANITVYDLLNYKIMYSLDGYTWSENNYSFKNASQDEYVVYFKITADFYQTVIDSVSIKIRPKDLTIYPVEGQYKIYGDGDSNIDQMCIGNIKGETPRFSGKFSRQSGEDVGLYLISQGTRDVVDNGAFLKSNYNLIFDQSKEYYYQIKPRDIYIELLPSGKIYGEEDPGSVEYICYNTIETPASTGYFSRESGEDVGLYDIYKNTFEFVDNVESGFKASNFNLVFDTQLNSDKFEIMPRQLVIIPDSNIQKVYNTQDPEFTFTYMNNVDSQIPGFEGSLSRESGEDVGEYNYKLGSLTLKDNNDFKAANYRLALNVNAAKFVINHGVLTGCEVESKQVIYDGLTHTLNPISTIENDVSIFYSLNQIQWEVGLPSYKDVGEYTVFFKFEKANFVSVKLSATLKITKYDLVITPDANQFKYYGDNNQKLMFSSINPLTGQGEVPAFDGSLARLAGEDVGNYLICAGDVNLIDGTNFKASNYNLIFDNSSNISFEILPRQILLTPNKNQTKTYGKIDPELTFTITNLAFDELATTQGSLSRQIGENVGKYKILQGDLKLVSYNNFKTQNYILIFNEQEIEFEIIKANITITVEDKTTYYSDALDTDFSSVVSGDYVSGDNLNILYYCEVNSGSLRGDYPILASADNSNYNITINNGIYHVLFKTFEVQFYALGNYIGSAYVEHFALINTFDIPQINIPGYDFVVWKKINPDTSFVVIDVYSYQVESDVVLTASMELKFYKIYMHTNNEFNEVIEKSYTILDEDILLNAVEKEGHTFDNWYDNSSLQGDPVTTVPTGSYGDKHYYAKWNINTYFIDLPTVTTGYQIDYLGNSLEQPYKSSFKFKVLLDEAYTQSLKTIQVYASYNNNTSRDKIEKDKQGFYSIDNIAKDYGIIVEGIKLNTYLINFIIEGQKQTITKEYGQELTVSEYPVIPEKENHKRIPAYWDLADGIKTVTKNYQINAIYTPDVYEVLIIVNDKKINKHITFGNDLNEEEIREELGLNMFEYLVFDQSLNAISKDSIINAKVESRIYILYICISCVVIVSLLIATIVVIKKRKARKFKWWQYAKLSNNIGDINKDKNNK